MLQKESRKKPGKSIKRSQFIVYKKNKLLSGFLGCVLVMGFTVTPFILYFACDADRSEVALY